MVEYKVQLQGDDGKEYVISYNALWQNLKQQMSYEERSGWNSVTTLLRDKIEKIEHVLRREILIPKLKLELLAFLKEHPNTETRVLNNHSYELPSFERIAWWNAQEELEKEGKIESISQGRGRNRLWKIVERGE